MSCATITDNGGAVRISCLFCDTMDVAFGHVFYGDHDADEFLAWHFLKHRADPRSVDNGVLAERVGKFLGEVSFNE